MAKTIDITTKKTAQTEDTNKFPNPVSEPMLAADIEPVVEVKDTKSPEVVHPVENPKVKAKLKEEKKIDAVAAEDTTFAGHESYDRYRRIRALGF